MGLQPRPSQLLVDVLISLKDMLCLRRCIYYCKAFVWLVNVEMMRSCRLGDAKVKDMGRRCTHPFARMVEK